METAATAVDQFVEQMGLIAQRDGGPRSAGRILGLLMIEGHPFTLSELASRLKISKASISTNARLLLNSGMVRQSARAGDRQDYYEIVPDPHSHMLEAVSARMRISAGLLSGMEGLFEADPERAERVRQLTDFYQNSADFLAQWSHHLHDTTGTPSLVPPTGSAK